MSATQKRQRTLHYNPRVGALHIKQGNVETGYWLDQLPHDFGPAVRCFRLSKMVPPGDDSPDHYDVVVEGNGGRCECRGHLRHGYCKHLSALLCLIQRGSL